MPDKVALNVWLLYVLIGDLRPLPVFLIDCPYLCLTLFYDSLLCGGFVISLRQSIASH